LISRHDASVKEILALTDILIDGPFIKELAENAGARVIWSEAVAEARLTAGAPILGFAAFGD
jgi:hypothetical protein